LKPALFYGLAGGLLIAVLKYIEYQHFVRAYPTEIYGGLLALIFTIIGIHLGLRWTRRQDAPAEPQPFATNAENLREIGITPRELEILGLIAEGLSNREIGERLFVSENTVKTHSSRVFEKLGVNRRVQAVQKGKDLGLIP
jgi:DNA-binding NarL/FixJ family response regulator